MSNYSGLDISNKSIATCIVNLRGKVLRETTTEMSLSGLEEALSGKGKLKCVVEASPLAETVCRWVESLGHEVEILEPRRAKAVTGGKRKTDRLDAEKLAQVCRTGWYTRVHRKSQDSRDLRSFLVARRELVKAKSALSSGIRGILRANGIVLNKQKGGAFEANVKSALLDASPLLREAIRPLLATWKDLEKRERQMYRIMERRVVKQRPEVLRLTSIPSIGPITAAAFVSTIDDPKRFSTSEKVGSYLGLVPSIYQSGETIILGRITKDGDELLRWLLIESATVMLGRCKKTFPLREWGLRLQEQKGFGKARVAVARKLACLLHHLWITGENFDPKAGVRA